MLRNFLFHSKIPITKQSFTLLGYLRNHQILLTIRIKCVYRPPMPLASILTISQEMFSSARWTYLSNLFITTHHTLLSLPTRPLLHIALSAGLSALKTPACHSQYASSSSNPHSTVSSVCPICSTELNKLARNVPYAHHTKSYVEQDPIVLPNGRIYGRRRLEELQRKLEGGVGEVGGGKVRDPTTGEDFGWEEVRKVYIS
jgi:macrophage erythroblast attacher